MRCNHCRRRKATKRVVWADGRAYVPICASPACATATKSMLRRKNGRMAAIVGVSKLPAGLSPKTGRRRRAPSRGKWIQKAVKRPGALHRQLGVPKGQRIPLSVLRWAAKQPGKLGQRARFALNVRGSRGRHA